MPLLPDRAQDCGGVAAVGPGVGVWVFVFSTGIVFVTTGTAVLVARAGGGAVEGTAGTSVLAAGEVVGTEVGVDPSQPGG